MDYDFEDIEETEWASISQRLEAWHDIASHPFFKDCYATSGTLIEAMIAKLDGVTER